MPTTIDARSLFAGKIRPSFRKQNTIAKSVSLSGFGFWTGDDVTLCFRPAPANTGLVFVRGDLPEIPHIPARIEYREEKPRQTSLVNGNARVDMVEHVLAALYAMRIDNCEIWTDQPEMPGFDGSSQAFYAALLEAGLVSQPAMRPVRVVTRAFHIDRSGPCYMIAATNRQGNCTFRYTLVPEEHYPLPMQRHQFDLSPDNFRDELAFTRTFIAKKEADLLLANGLCRRVTPQNVLVLTEDGPVENSFRYENECARHKTLDMVGDFALLGCDVIGTFESFRGGHRLNAECVRHILEKTLLLDDAYMDKKSQPEPAVPFREAA